MDYTKLWAKSDPWHPLWCHLLDVAAVCDALLPRFGGTPSLPTPWLLYIVALHDLGKADALFQKKAPDLVQPLLDAGFPMDVDPEKIGPFRHEERSAEWVRAHLAARGCGKRTLDVLESALKGHHGNFDPKHHDDIHRATWEPSRLALAGLVARAVGLDVDGTDVPDFEGESRSEVGVKLSGLIVLSDWIASNDDLYDYPNLPRSSAPAAYFQAARALAGRVIARLDLAESGPAFPGGQPLAFTTVWPDLATRPTQAALEAVVRAGVAPGLAILEAPMGEGKTEAAIYLGEEWNRKRGASGAYLALPTQATSNQMHTRYRKFLAQRPSGQSPPRLIHGMAWLLEDDTPTRAPETHGDDAAHGEEAGEEAARAREWFQSAKRALIAPEGVGTVDQALMAALNVKHGFLRLLGLSRKVLIVDECHAYDLYMTTILCRMLAWCRVLRIPVILLSATLSRRQKERLVAAYGGAPLPTPPSEDGQEAYPLLTFAPLDGAPFTRAVDDTSGLQRRVMVRAEPGPLDDLVRTAQLAAGLVKDGGCACVLVNTVAAAQKVFQALQAINPPNTELLLFHARFRAEARREIEPKVTDLFGKHPETGEAENPHRPRRAILVATQVVEQSLDVDFDVMVTQLAPIDLILQRSGRLWRHDRGKRRFGWDSPTLHILLPDAGGLDFGVSERIYKRETLLRTLALLHDRSAFDLPADFRPLVEGCYGAAPLPAGHPIPDQVLADAQAEREREDAAEEGQARTHLVPEPVPEVFAYAQNTKSVDEAEDGQPTDYFHARTRLGDETRTVLFLCDPETSKAFRKAQKTTQGQATHGNPRWSPGRKWLRTFFLQKANVPARWLLAEPLDGFEPFLQGKDTPRWLRRSAVLIMPGGEWRGVLPGRNGKPGTPVVLRDDPELGLMLEPVTPALGGAVDADAQ